MGDESIIVAGALPSNELRIASGPVPTVDDFDKDSQPENRASALHLVERIFQRYHVLNTNRNRLLDAIPDLGSPENATEQAASVPVTELIGMNLPPRHITFALLDSYLESTHWYLNVLHAPSFRAQLERIVATGRACPRQRPFLMLVLVTLVIGARYMSDKEKAAKCGGVSLAELGAAMFEAVERWYLPSMDLVTVDTVAFSFLMASNYLFSRRTRAAYITMGTTVRAAQSIGLHRESLWGNITAGEREARRRVWWLVFIGAGFFSMSYGTSPMLNEADCSVQQPLDVEDNSLRCPGFDSLEKRDDGRFLPVTMGSYNRYKAKLYMIASSIMQQIYFTQHHEQGELVRLLLSFHQRLLAWERSMPPELRLESHSPADLQSGLDASSRRVFAIQALTLRISYDNVQIFLFRPLITLGKMPKSRDRTRESSPTHQAPNLSPRSTFDRLPSRLLETAQAQCWTSALRTSFLSQRTDVLDLLQFSFPALHVGVHVFSAGVMLGLLALSNPLSPRGQECKRGIARLIQIPKSTRLQSHIWSQMTQVLTDLMHVIASEETKAIIAAPDGPGLAEGCPNLPVFGSPPELYSAAAHLSSNSGMQTVFSQPEHISHGRADPSWESRNSGQPIQGHDSNAAATQQFSERPIAAQHGQVLPSTEAERSDPPSIGLSNEDTMNLSDLWIASHAEWLGDPLQAMSQVWMWDGSFPYH